MASVWVILSDFDGTILKEDASQLILSEYAKGDWKRYDEMLAHGEIGFEDCISNQFKLIRVGETTILRDYDRFVAQRKNFNALVDFARARKVPLTIVSGGLEFIIKEFLQRNGWKDFVGLHVGKLRYAKGGMAVSFPPLRQKGSLSFKDDLVLRLKCEGKRVVYIGDGSYDFKAALASDLAFAVRGSKLARLGREGGGGFYEFEDFAEVVEILTRHLGVSAKRRH